MELTGIEKNKIAKFDAMTAAHKAGHPEVALMILNDQIVVRSRRRGQWSINDYRREVPAGAVALIFVDYTSQTPEYYIVPAGEAREIFKKLYDAHRKEHGGERPRAPGSYHVGLDVGEVQHWQSAWTSWATSGSLWDH